MTDDPVGIAWARLLVDSKGICYYTRFYFTPVASPPFFPPGTR
jgi:hypothetical protein